MCVVRIWSKMGIRLKHCNKLEIVPVYFYTASLVLLYVPNVVMLNRF